MKSATKLPFQFDADRMLLELKSISSSFRLIKNAYTGNSLLGMHLITPNPNGKTNEKGESFHFTEELERCPYLQEVLNTFQSDKFTFRTQNLLPGGKIERHNDGDKGLNSNIVRLNIPVSTHKDVYTYFNDERISMKNGECWLPEVTKIHEMENRSNETRWQLMIDCDLNDWWKDILSDCGFDLTKSSQFQYHSLEELQRIQSNFLEMGIDKNDALVKEIETAILDRS